MIAHTPQEGPAIPQIKNKKNSNQKYVDKESHRPSVLTSSLTYFFKIKFLKVNE